MANITWLGADYQNVDKVYLPETGTGNEITFSLGGGTPSATAHTIYFEFSDGTDTTITAYYDSSFISDTIAATTPTTYGSKTVTLAQLDGVTWYSYDPTERWETLYENESVGFYPESDPEDPPYCWIQSLGDVYPEVDSVWRITFKDITYRCTATSSVFNGHTYVIIGNPKWAGGNDDGSDVPFVLYNIGYGAWSGSADLKPYSIQGNVYLKVERKVLT